MLLKRLFVGAAAAAMAFAPISASAHETASGDQKGPRLVVTVVVDQLSSNLFNQYRRYFTGGFKRLMDEGLIHANGFQTHGVTETCPGHSTVLTGMHPTHTGIGVNYSNDDATGQGRYCMASQVNTLAHGKVTDNGNVGTELLLVDTLGDWLQEQRPGSRVIAVSGKDRGAMNLAGHNGQAFWFTDGFGLTTYVKPGETAQQRLSVVERFNRDYPNAENGQRWKGDIERCSTLNEEIDVVDGRYKSSIPPYINKFSASPLYDEETVRAAIYVLDTQRLGEGEHTDMLGVSLSGTDIIGHTFGTQGPEMCEQLVRLDAALGKLLERLDQVEGGVILSLTADHGGSDINERTRARGFPFAGRMVTTLNDEVNAALRQQFNLDFDPLQRGSSGLRIVDTQGRALAEPLRSQIANVAVEMLSGKGPYHTVLFRDDVLKDPIPNSLHPQLLTVRERMRLSAVEGVSADLMVALQPALASGGRLGGNMSSHGQPWDYDRGVPIIFWTPNGVGQERFMPVRTIDIAPTIANVIGVETPKLDGRCMDLGIGVAAPCKAD